MVVALVADVALEGPKSISVISDVEGISLDELSQTCQKYTIRSSVVIEKNFIVFYGLQIFFSRQSY